MTLVVVDVAVSTAGFGAGPMAAGGAPPAGGAPGGSAILALPFRREKMRLSSVLGNSLILSPNVFNLDRKIIPKIGGI